MDLNHNHETSKEMYHRYPFIKKKMSLQNLDDFKVLSGANASNRLIAERLSDVTGQIVTTRDVRNKRNKNKGLAAEEVLKNVEENGGTVVKITNEANEVKILWIQTKIMREQQQKIKPWLYQLDTTHKTNQESYKMMCPTYLNTITNTWCVAGILLMSNETKENIKLGLNAFKDSLDYEFMEDLIFMCDKDFTYINVIKGLFTNSSVLLCQVHVDRHFKDKVFVGKAFWSDSSQLTGEQKAKLLELLRKTLKAHSYAQFLQEEEKLLNYSRNLYVYAGAKNAKSFSSYYIDNWKNISAQWATYGRRRMPTRGCNDTNSAESIHSLIKVYLREKFNNQKPEICELIKTLIYMFDKRSQEQNIEAQRTTLTMKIVDPNYNKLMQTASLHLNRTGIEILKVVIHVAQKKEGKGHLALNENHQLVYESFPPHYYPTYNISQNATKCDCAWYSRQGICRHLIFLRKYLNVPIFSKDMFHPSLLLQNHIQGSMTVRPERPLSPYPNEEDIETLIQLETAGRNIPQKDSQYTIANNITEETKQLLLNKTTDDFEHHSKFCMNINKLIENGIPDKIFQIIENPDEYELIRKHFTPPQVSQSENMVSTSQFNVNNAPQQHDPSMNNVAQLLEGSMNNATQHESFMNNAPQQSMSLINPSQQLHLRLNDPHQEPGHFSYNLPQQPGMLMYNASQSAEFSMNDALQPPEIPINYTPPPPLPRGPSLNNGHQLALSTNNVLQQPTSKAPQSNQGPEVYNTESSCVSNSLWSFENSYSEALGLAEADVHQPPATFGEAVRNLSPVRFTKQNKSKGRLTKNQGNPSMLKSKRKTRDSIE